MRTCNVRPARRPLRPTSTSSLQGCDQAVFYTAALLAICSENTLSPISSERISCRGISCQPLLATAIQSRMQDLYDVIYGKVKVNMNCGSLPRADANWTETCKSMEASVAKLQLPRRPRAQPRPPLPDFASQSFSSEVSSHDSSQTIDAPRAQPRAPREETSRSTSRTSGDGNL